MDPGLEKAKILMAQANKPIAILRKRIFRFEEMKAFAFFEFIMFDYIIMNNGYENLWCTESVALIRRDWNHIIMELREWQKFREELEK